MIVLQSNPVWSDVVLNYIFKVPPDPFSHHFDWYFILRIGV